MKKICLFAFFSVFPAVLFCQTRPDALKLYNAERYGEAVSVCLSEIEENPKNTDSYVVLCWSLVKSGRCEEAAKWAAEGRKIARYDHRLIEILGEAKYYLGENTEALSLFQEYVSFVPKGSRISTVYYLTGEIYLRLGKYQHADIALSAAVLYERLNAVWWVRLGYAREQAQEYRSALDAYEQALRLDPSAGDAVRGRERVTRNIR